MMIAARSLSISQFPSVVTVYSTVWADRILCAGIFFPVHGFFLLHYCALARYTLFLTSYLLDVGAHSNIRGVRWASIVFSLHCGARSNLCG